MKLWCVYSIVRMKTWRIGSLKGLHLVMFWLTTCVIVALIVSVSVVLLLHSSSFHDASCLYHSFFILKVTFSSHIERFRNVVEWWRCLKCTVEWIVLEVWNYFHLKIYSTLVKHSAENPIRLWSQYAALLNVPSFDHSSRNVTLAC